MIRVRNYFIQVPAAGLTALLSLGVGAQVAQSADTPAATHTEADNSKVNVRDQKSTALTSDNQTSKKDDVELIRKIRRSLTADSSLSVNAQNVKIISHAGNVILKGPVNSSDERAAVERVAQNIAGKENVASELTVAAK